MSAKRKEKKMKQKLNKIKVKRNKIKFIVYTVTYLPGNGAKNLTRSNS
jgi:hypothetical protein